MAATSKDEMIRVGYPVLVYGGRMQSMFCALRGDAQAREGCVFRIAGWLGLCDGAFKQCARCT